MPVLLEYVQFSHLRVQGPSGQPPSANFANIVSESLFRGSVYKATCPMCKQFSTNESRKSIPSKDLPSILALNTSIYEAGIASHRLWLDGRYRQGTFVQPFIEVRGQVDGIDEAEVVRYELRVSVKPVKYLRIIYFLCSQWLWKLYQKVKSSDT